VTLRFGFEGKRPALYASVRSVKDNKLRILRFLLDTGACQSCVPASFAPMWGYSSADAVGRFKMPGIGVTWTGYYLPFRFALVESLNTPVAAWESSSSEICFLNELEPAYGLLGMDAISQWTELKLTPKNGNGGTIEITI
jgi:hypothetical protein